jgi:hypothetical protein
VEEVELSNEINAMLATILLDSGEKVELFLAELMLEALKETYRAEIQVKYFKDCPERRSKPEDGSDDER